MVKRRRLRIVECRQFVRQDFDLAGLHIRVDRALGSLPDLTFDSQDVFTTNSLSFGENLGAIGIEYDLQQSLAITQIDKYDTTMVATPVYPAAYGNFLSDLTFIYLSAIVAAHGRYP